MASITSVTPLYFEPSGNQRAALYRLTGVNTGDTIDASTIGSIAFKIVQKAVFIDCSQNVGVVASVSGTIITITSAGMANGTVLMLIIGEG